VDYFLMGRQGWSLSEQEFIQVLTSRWPSASIKPLDIPGGARSIDFRIQMPESVLDGHFNLEGSIAVFYGAPRDCAEFALGYQALFLQGQPFLLFDEGYNRSIELRPETTIENIIRALHDAPGT
jgi:hypothetical protein